MKKVTLHKIDELCHRAYQTKRFQQELPQLRSKYDIPPHGFLSEEAYEHWLSENFGKKNSAFSEDCYSLTERHGLPPTAKLRVREYVLFGTSGIRPESLDVWVPFEEMGVCDIELPGAKGGEWERSGVPIVRLIIPDHATQRDVLRFVRSHWMIMQNILAAQRGNKPKKMVRAVQDRQTQEAVLRLSKLPVKELRRLAQEHDPDGKFTYKETAIKELISRELGKKLSEEAIKKIVARRAK